MDSVSPFISYCAIQSSPLSRGGMAIAVTAILIMVSSCMPGGAVQVKTDQHISPEIKTHISEQSMQIIKALISEEADLDQIPLTRALSTSLSTEQGRQTIKTLREIAEAGSIEIEHQYLLSRPLSLIPVSDLTVIPPQIDTQISPILTGIHLTGRRSAVSIYTTTNPGLQRAIVLYLVESTHRWEAAAISVGPWAHAGERAPELLAQMQTQIQNGHFGAAAFQAMAVQSVIQPSAMVLWPGHNDMMAQSDESIEASRLSIQLPVKLSPSFALTDFKIVSSDTQGFLPSFHLRFDGSIDNPALPAVLRRSIFDLSFLFPGYEHYHSSAHFLITANAGKKLSLVLPVGNE
jgi:hypothetical protein